MDFLLVGLQAITYFVVGVLIAKITLAVQAQLRTQRDDEPLSDDMRLGVASLIVPFWVIFVALFIVYLVLSFVVGLFSKIIKPLI